MSTRSLSHPYDISAFSVDSQTLDSPFVDVESFLPHSDNCSTSSSENMSRHLYLQLAHSQQEGSGVEVKSPDDHAHYSSRFSESSGSPIRSLSVNTLDHTSTNMDPGTIQHLIEEQNLKKQRLARKAELARITRKRKKERLSELEVEVKRLKAEIVCLRKRNSQIMELSRSGKNILVDEVVLEEQKTLQRAIEKVVFASGHEPSNDTYSDSFPSLVEELMEVFTKRALTSKSHLYSLEACLSPCMPLRFLNWAMCQDDKFYEDPQGLWNCLFKQQVGLSDDQLQSLLCLRSEMRRQRETSTFIDEIYRRLKPLVEKHLLESQNSLDLLRNILTPEQLAKFFVWVEQNQLCVKMLESVTH